MGGEVSGESISLEGALLVNAEIAINPLDECVLNLPPIVLQ